MRTIHPGLVVAAALAALIAAAPAGAATISYSGGAGGTVVYSAAAGETLNLSVGYHAGCGVGDGGTPLDCVTFFGNAATWTPTGNCQAQTDGSVWCLLDSDHSGARVVGGDGNDAVSVHEADIDGFPAASGYPIEIDGGAGDDRLDGGSGPETIHGGPGADLVAGRGGSDVLYGDDGNDTIYGDGATNGNEGLGGGDDQLYGGAGDDVLTGDTPSAGAAIGHDLLDGGPGTDTVKSDWFRFDGNGGDADPAPTVTFDGVANDGRPGENDDVVGIERIESGVPAGPTPITLIGDDGPNTFMLLFTNGVVHGGGGDDVIAGSDYADTLDGGSGNDRISGGFGDDVITGGPGRDDIGGDRTAACEYGPIFGSCTIGSGNDTIYAADGERDTIDCGPGADVAYVDAIDSVAGCETVHVAAGGGAGGGGAGAGGGHAQPPAATLTLGRQHLATIALTRRLAVGCRLPRAGRCTVTATITRATARHLHLKVKAHARTYTLGKGSVRLTHAGRKTVHVTLSRTTARALRRARTLRVTLTIRATYAGGSYRTTTRRTTLKR